MSLTFIGLFLGTATILLCMGSGVFPITARVLARAPIIQTLPNTPQLMQQGDELYESGNFSKAVTVWQQALSTSTTRGDKLNQAKVLSDLSLAYQQLGQWSQATVAISDSLKLLQTSSTLGASKQGMRILAQALNTQGSLQLAQGQTEQALATWQSSATIYAQVGARNEVTGSLINQAQALQTLGLGFQAKETLTQVEQALELQLDSVIKAIGLCSLGNTLRAVGDLARSRQVLQQSLDIAQKLKSPQQVSAALFSLGNTAHFQHDSQAALKFFQRATDASPTLSGRTQAQIARLNILVETKLWSDARSLWSQIQPEIVNLSASRATVYARINLAQSLMQMRQTSNFPSLLEVGQLLATAVEQARSISDRRAEAYALGYLGRLYERTQQWSDAQSLTQQALALAQSIDAPDISYRWQWQLGRLLKARGDIQGAIAAYTLAVNDLRTLRSDLVSVNPDIQFSFRDEVEPV